MRNKRLFLVLGGAVIFGLIAAVSVTRYLARAQGKGDFATVVVAKVNIPPGTKLIAEQLISVEYPRNSLPEGVFAKPAELIDRVAVTSIVAREAITDSKLAPVGSAGGLSAVIPEGYRAMTVKIDDVMGLSGFALPGALVDVVVVINPPDKNVSADPISKVVLQNIKVLANGQNIDRPQNERESSNAKTVTLQVTPEQAEKLALAATEGKLRLMMRNAGDQNDVQTTGITKRSLLTGEKAMPVIEPGPAKNEQPKPVVPRVTRRKVYPRKATFAPVKGSITPAAPPQQRKSVEVIEGVKRRNVEFP